ncbi:MAG: DUF1957 domain-containing protein [Deltaproteobacteria bacterium]|nr:DUF1957 domain-containing protein [Deltaproteobacteria bacterium]
MIPGHVLLVLHAHLPFVRHPEHPDFLEEDWLFEAISEVYVPLLGVFDRLSAERVPFQLGLTISPTLASMLADPLLRARYAARLDAACTLAEAEVARTGSTAPAYAEAARHHRDRLRAVRERYHGAYGGDLLAAFRRLEAEGHLELYTCTATHGFLPVLRSEPSSVNAQVAVAVEAHRALLGRAPRGIWLAECGYYPGVDAVLARHGLRAFFLDAHGLWRGTPAPVFGVHQPVLTPAGVAAFGRDPACSEQVWSAEVGYPADPDYLEFHLDLAHHVDAAWLRPYLNPDSGRRLTGLRYHRVTGRTGPKAPYRPGQARAKAQSHAAHFLAERERQLAALGTLMGPREPLVLAPYDAELFGHWWAEGPVFLEALLREAARSPTVRFTGPLAYLERFPDLQVLRPAESSWGARGDASTWIGPANDWMYRHLHEAARRMMAAADGHAGAAGLERRVLQQSARELLLAQSSDWAFILHTGAAPEYAAGRAREHLGAVFGLLDQLDSGQVDAAWLAGLEARNNLFPGVDPGVYRSAP